MKTPAGSSLPLVLAVMLCAAAAACGNSKPPGADAAPDTQTSDADAADRGGEVATDTKTETNAEAGATDGAADTGTDASTPGDADAGTEVGATDAGPFVAIAPCLTPDDYVTTPHTVSTGANVYQPACLRVLPGATVAIQASATHPIEARAGGSPGNPIPTQLTTATVTFSTPGFYPFLCPEHVDQGMIGVIWVAP